MFLCLCFVCVACHASLFSVVDISFCFADVHAFVTVFV